MSEQNYEVTLRFSKEDSDRLDAFIEGVEHFTKMRERAEAAEANMVLGSLSTLIDDSIAAREKLAARAEKAEAEVGRLRSLVTALHDNGNARAAEMRSLREAFKACEERERLALAELERVKAEHVWTTPEDRQG